MKKKLLIILLIAVFQATNAQMEKVDTLEYRYPTDIVVTGTRMSAPLKEVPFSASIIGGNTIRQLYRSIAADEPMKLVPGVKVDNQANGSRVHLSIRGQGILTERGIRGIKVVYDGIPINDPSGFAPDFFDVDFSSVEKIEVLRGPAASLYGGSASGGIINILTATSPDLPLSAQVHSTFGSNAFWKGFGQFGGDVKDVNYSVSFSRALGAGYREHTHFWGDNVYGKVVYTPSSSILLTPIFGWTNSYHENPEGITLDQYRQDPKQANPDAVPFNEYLETNRVTNGLTGLITLQPHHEIQFNAYVKRTLFTEANNRTFNHRSISTPGTSVQYSFKEGAPDDFIKNTFNIGTDLQWQSIDETRTENLNGIEGTSALSREQIKQSGAGVFALDKVDIGAHWSAMMSLRYDKIQNTLNDLLKNPYNLSGSADFSKTTGRVGITYSPTNETNLFANWGQGFLPPATEELAQNPDQFGGFNTHLIPATSNSFELGVRGAVANVVYYDLTGFVMTTDNDFDRYRISDSLRNQETFYRNSGSSRRLGIEFYSRYTPVQPLELQVAYTYSRFTYTIGSPVPIVMDDPTIIKNIVDGNWLPNSPQHQLMVDLQYMPVRGLSIGLSTETLSKAYIDGANVGSEAAEGYTLIHARIEYDWSIAGLTGVVSLNARNISNTKYVAFTEPDPGGNAYQPGAGREFFGGIKIQL